MDREELTEFINSNISEFHSNRINALRDLDIDSIILRKNPYLFKAKNIHNCGDLVKSLTDAYLSSREETIFGEFLEKLAIFVCHEELGGYKSGICGVDLEFNFNDARYIVSIKSGPNWGNSSQITKMKENFKTAKKTLRTQNSNMNVIAVNGCCYGKDDHPDKGDYFKYCGQRFWEFITGDENFYTEIIEPLGYQAKEKNDAFFQEYDKLINNLTRTFMEKYCLPDGAIDWEKIVKMNSQKK